MYLFNTTLPKDPHLLVSLINTKLRNEFDSLDDLYAHYHLDEKEFMNTMLLNGFHYNSDSHQFIKR